MWVRTFQNCSQLRFNHLLTFSNENSRILSDLLFEAECPDLLFCGLLVFFKNADFLMYCCRNKPHRLLCKLSRMILGKAGQSWAGQLYPLLRTPGQGQDSSRLLFTTEFNSLNLQFNVYGFPLHRDVFCFLVDKAVKMLVEE